MDRLSPEQLQQARERAKELESPICPYCGKSGVEVTVHGDPQRKFLGLCSHRWAESDLPSITDSVNAKKPWANRHIWGILGAAFDQFRKWSAVKSLLELAGIWKWIVLGASVVEGFLLPSFSKLDPALRVLVVLATVAVALIVTLFAVALNVAIKTKRADTSEPAKKQSSVKPKPYHVAIVAVLIILAVAGSIFGPKPLLVQQKLPSPLAKDAPAPPSPSIPVPASPKQTSSPATPGVVNNCPEGICISGGTANNPTVNNFGPPPLELAYTQRVLVSDKEGFIKTEIRVVPNLPVSAPVGVAVEFNNPITEPMGFVVDGSNTTTGGGPYRIGTHALITVGVGFNPQHALILTVYSILPVMVIKPISLAQSKAKESPNQSSEAAAVSPNTLKEPVNNNAPGGIANSGTINGGAIVNNTYAEKQRLLSDSDVEQIASKMMPYAGDPIWVIVQVPFTKEMQAFGARLAKALADAKMMYSISYISFLGGGCSSDGGVTFYSSGKYARDAWVLEQALVTAKIIETAYPTCLYGNGKDDLQTIVWINRP